METLLYIKYISIKIFKNTVKGILYDKLLGILYDKLFYVKNKNTVSKPSKMSAFDHFKGSLTVK